MRRINDLFTAKTEGVLTKTIDYPLVIQRTEGLLVSNKIPRSSA